MYLDCSRQGRCRDRRKIILKNNRDICGVTQKAFVFNDEGKFLVLKRTAEAPSKPNKWDLPGGSVDFGENPYESIEREIREEAGIEVEDLEPFDVWGEVDQDNEFWTTIAYRAKVKSGEVKLSYEHDDCKWVTSEGFAKFCESKRFMKFLEKLK